jgi:hypothetical protein
MKIWTFEEAKEKIERDLDLEDEEFIKFDEMVGYFNEGIGEAAAEILKIDEDYFLTSYPIPLVLGQSEYDYPYNMYAFKERGIMYSNGSIIYPVTRFKRKDKFFNMAMAEQYGSSDDYRWFHTNDSAQGGRINLIPPSRETAIVPPNTSTFTPLVLWYIRNANRIPVTGEYIEQYEQLVQSTAINTSTEVLTVAETYVTGDQVKLSTSGTMPGGLSANTVYYVILASSTTIKLATSLANARAGTAINITSTGSGILTIAIAATEDLILATEIDIPEFTEYVIQKAKVRCMAKEGHPNLADEKQTLAALKEQMVSTLTQAQQDDENEVTPDLSAYWEMS